MRSVSATKIVCLALVFSGLARSQENILPPPKAPLVGKMPNLASWTIDYKYREDMPRNGGKIAQATPTPRPNPYIFSDRKRKVVVTKGKPVWCEQVVWDSGAATETWIVENMRVGKIPGSQKIAVIPFSSEGSESFDYRRSDFEGLDWIKPEFYRGAVLVGGELVYFFEEGEASPIPSKAVESPIGKWGTNRWALIAPNRGLPIVSYDGLTEKTYTYHSAPVEIPRPPKQFLDIFNKLQSGLPASSGT